MDSDNDAKHVHDPVDTNKGSLQKEQEKEEGVMPFRSSEDAEAEGGGNTSDGEHEEEDASSCGSAVIQDGTAWASVGCSSTTSFASNATGGLSLTEDEDDKQPPSTKLRSNIAAFRSSNQNDGLPGLFQNGAIGMGIQTTNAFNNLPAHENSTLHGLSMKEPYLDKDEPGSGSIVNDDFVNKEMNGNTSNDPGKAAATSAPSVQDALLNKAPSFSLKPAPTTAVAARQTRQRSRSRSPVRRHQSPTTRSQKRVPRSQRISPTNLPKRSQSMRDRAEKEKQMKEQQQLRQQLQTQSQSPKKHQIKHTNSNSSKSSSRLVQEDELWETTDDEDDSLLEIVKARAALALRGSEGSASAPDLRQLAAKETGQKEANGKGGSSEGKARRVQSSNDVEELPRPGAYSKAPGDAGFRRNRTFQRKRFSNRYLLADPDEFTEDELKEYNDIEHKSGSTDSGDKAAARDYLATSTARAKSPVEDGNAMDDLDTKPAARPQVSPTSSPARNSSLSPPQRRPRRGRRQPLSSRIESSKGLQEEGMDVLQGLDGNSAHSRRPSVGTMSKRSSSIRFFGDVLVDSGARRPSDRNSLRLSALSRFSMTRQSHRGSWFELDSVFGGSTCSSLSNDNNAIHEWAQESVSHFMRNYQANLQPSVSSNIDNQQALPIAATVVPSEEDLEGLIRSRLEEELRTHLTQELMCFRESLLSEIVRRGQVQVADPVVDYSDPQLGNFEESNASFATPLLAPVVHATSNEASAPHLLVDEEDKPDDDFAYAPNVPIAHEDSSHREDGDEILELQPIGEQNRRRRGGIGDDIRQSIRQSLRLEMGVLGLADELNLNDAPIEIEEAQVIAQENNTCRDLEAQQMSVEPEAGAMHAIGPHIRGNRLNNSNSTIPLSKVPDKWWWVTTKAYFDNTSLTSSDGAESCMHTSLASRRPKQQSPTLVVCTTKGLIAFCFGMLLVGASIGTVITFLVLRNLHDLT